MTNKKDNKKNNPQTTGHKWDDNIEEYNTPAPRWWLTVWAISIIWAIIYWFFFPSWPTIKGHLKGSKNWSAQSQLASQEAEIRAKKEVHLEKMEQLNFAEILQDQELLQFALNGGESAFKENCAACHGTGAQGFEGFPNLNDDDWLWGGKLDDIYQTLKYGIRSGHEKARDSQMPAFGKDEILNDKGIDDVTQYVKYLAKLDQNNNKNGQKIFAENCAVCHGKNGKGDRSVGSPNLTDSIWLYGSDDNSIKEMIYNPKQGVMPNWNERLDDNTIKQLTIYVHSLGGGE